MKWVAQILRSKSDPAVYTVAPTASVFDVLKVMAEKNIGALAIVEGERIVGMLSERDYARKVVLMGKSSKETPVADIMTQPVLYVGPQQSTEDCMALMTEKRLRHLPVLDDGKLIGIISIGDLVKDIISEQSFVIEQLQFCISGQLVDKF